MRKKQNEILGEIVKEEEFDPIKEAREYFERLKASKEEQNLEDLEGFLKAAESLVKKYKITRQESARKRVEQYVEWYNKEIKIIKSGFTQYIKRSDIEKGINGTRDIYICTLEEYERDIPDDVVDIVAKVLEEELFDQIYIIFTDYSDETKQREHQKKVERDPIMIGCVVKESTYGKKYFSEHMWFICDWIDQYCELTLSKLVEKISKDVSGDIVYDAVIPDTQDKLLSAITATEQEETEIKTTENFLKSRRKIAKNK